jgi:hypothetical protein
MGTTRVDENPQSFMILVSAFFTAEYINQCNWCRFAFLLIFEISFSPFFL